MNYLYGYHWPGNIRELRNVIEYIYVMQGDLPEMNHSHLPEYITETNSSTESIHSITKTAALPVHHYERNHTTHYLKNGLLHGRKERSGTNIRFKYCDTVSPIKNTIFPADLHI